MKMNKRFYCYGKGNYCDEWDRCPEDCEFFKNIGGEFWDVPEPVKVMLDPGAKMPTRAHKWDAGYDLFSREAWTLFPGKSHEFDIGVHVQIPHGMGGLIVSKSGLNSKHGIVSTGLIDSDYTGSIHVTLYNHGMNPVSIAIGQKISQLVIVPVFTPDLDEVDEMEDTERGNGGFGSTGIF